MAGHILLVEDTPTNRIVVTRILSRAGATVSCAENGLVAVTRLLEDKDSPPIDLVLMDINLPGRDGYELTREIKADSSTRAIPVIALTAHAMSGEREKALKAGCDDYDTKPVDLPRLLGKMQSLLE